MNILSSSFFFVEIGFFFMRNFFRIKKNPDQRPGLEKSIDVLT
jgi:hypothetical protein